MRLSAALASLAAVTVLGVMPSRAGAAQQVVAIDIVDAPRPDEEWGFAPGTRTVRGGTWVTWSNAGYEAHSVTAVDGSFDSGVLNPSEGYAWYFDQDGTFDYVCSLHAWMTGTIVVRPQEPGPTATEEPGLTDQ